MEMETVCGLCAKELEKEITVGADLYRDLWHGNACQSKQEPVLFTVWKREQGYSITRSWELKLLSVFCDHESCLCAVSVWYWGMCSWPLEARHLCWWHHYCWENKTHSKQRYIFMKECEYIILTLLFSTGDSRVTETNGIERYSDKSCCQWNHSIGRHLLIPFPHARVHARFELKVLSSLSLIVVTAQ
jgi:hypothetical protein